MSTASFALVINIRVVTGLVATASGTTQVNVTWNPLGGSNHYEVYRTDHNAPLSLRATPTGTSYTDIAVAAGTTYVYQVRSIDGSGVPPAMSQPEMATTIVFTDDPLVPGATPVKAIHVTQLRAAVLAVAAAVGQSPTFTDHPLPPGVAIKAGRVAGRRCAAAT
jgi:fibronectin type 3 domain-containing protein